MDLLPLSLPHDFIAAQAPLRWREIRFGLEHDLLAPDAPRELALALLETSDDPAVVALACLDEGELARPLVDTLADAEPPESPEEIQHKWLYLVLSWIHEHRASYADPLETVEVVYADFDYPEEIAGFVRYMPAAPGGPPPSPERLYETWAAWLAAQRSRYAPPRP